MGFKRIHEFNIALLAKQGWRLLIKPDSLVGKLLKARYFPRCGFLEAQLGCNPSYIWRSILAGQQVLKQGVARTIGDGVDTNIWGWPWLADTGDPNLQTPCAEYLIDAKVSGLMDANGQWDVEVLEDLFTDTDVQKILATPTSCNYKDYWRWKGDIRGLYSVKHGYHLLTANSMVVDSQLVFTTWDRLWRLPVPPKVKNLLWRCAQNILPVKEILKSRRVWIGGGCPLCDHVEETPAHLFCHCIVARQLWENADVLQGRSLPVFMDDVLCLPTVDRAILMVAVFWTVWSTRNDCVWRNGVWMVECLRRQVHGLVDSWKEAHGVSNPLASNCISPVWTCPPQGMLKCNIDAAVFDNDAGFGAVIRDHLGTFVVAKSDTIGCVRDPLLAEAMAIKEALAWIKELGHNNLIIETDCLNFCLAFHSRNLDFSYVGSVIQQCRIIARDIGNLSVRHVKRSVNHVAHVLARATGSLSVRGS